MDVFGNTRCCSPSVFLDLFEKLLATSKEVDEKFVKAVEDKKKVSTALPQWGELYHLGNHEKFHKAPKVNETFSCLLNRSISSSGRFRFPWMTRPSWSLVLGARSSHSPFLFGLSQPSLGS